MRLRRLATLALNESRNYYRHHYRFVPWQISIETTTACNTNCLYCAHSQAKLPGPHMDLELFKAVVDACKDFVTGSATAHSRGEPLMYPHILEAIEYMNRNGLDSRLYTNGSLLTEDMATGLIDAGLNGIMVSIDTNDGAEFERVRRLSWRRVLHNIERLVRIRDRTGSALRVMVGACVGDFNIRRIPEIRSFWESRVDEFFVRPVFPNVPREILEQSPIYIQPFECMHPYDVLHIRVDGKVSLCCSDWHDLVILGKVDRSVTKKTLLDIYNSRAFNRVRGGLEFGRGAPAICAYCQSRRRVERLQRQIAELEILER